MTIRWTLLLVGSLVVAAAGGVMAAAPILRVALEDAVGADRAPTPELEADRIAVLAGMERMVGGLSHHAEQLELLSDLLADAAGERSVGTVSYEARSPEK